MTKIYFDEIFSAQVVDGVVRFRVGLRDPSQEGSQNPTGHLDDTIICSLAGLVKLQAQVEGLLGALAEKNVVKKRES